MKHRIFKKTIALLLAICLLPVIRPIHAVTEEDSPLSSATEVQTQSAIEPAIKKDTSNSTEVFSALVEGTQILSHINEDVFRGNKHVTRLLHEEDLNNYVFLNSDGSKTVYYMDEEVKFIDANGTVREKNLSLSGVREGFSTTLNDVGLTLPIRPSSGIRLCYSGYDITLIPEGGSNLVVARQNGNSVTYPDYFGTGMSLVYTPTLSGVKEDILLDRYRGVTDFTFLLETDGLGLYQSNGKYYLATAENAEMRIDLGEVVAYDSAGHFNLGSMTVTTVTANQQYRLTLHANEDFLQDANTVYPVWIDPTLQVSDNSHGINAIEDITLYSGRPNANCNWQYLACGYYDSTYQRGRTLVRLSGLTSSSDYTSVTADQIASVKFYIKEATGSATRQINLYHNFSSGDWVETTATWNSLFQYVSDDNFNSDTLYATANAVSNTYTEFNITQLVKNWKTWVHSPDKGFILKVADETAPHKAFCSSEYSNSSDRPYVVFTYLSQSGFLPLSGYELDYEPSLWDGVVESNCNCYAYAINNQLFEPTDIYPTRKQQPGQYYNKYALPEEIIDFENIEDGMKWGAIKDSERYNQINGTSLVFLPIGQYEVCPAGTYKVALVESSYDYHWYRQDSDGYWSHKQGLTPVKRTDNSGNLIKDPMYADRGAYTTFVGYFAVTPWNNIYNGARSTSVTASTNAVVSQSTTTISHTQLGQIEIGMSMDEVLAIVGHPGMDIGSGTIIYQYFLGNGQPVNVVFRLVRSEYVVQCIEMGDSQ